MLLAGDAAHLNNPLGGFGLNSALQDAINLTDKLYYSQYFGGNVVPASGRWASLTYRTKW